MAGARPANRGNRSANRVGSAVSRRLRADGHNVVAPSRRHISNCMTVSSADDHVSVLVDYGIAAKNTRVAESVKATVAAWSEVSDLDVTVLDDGSVYVHFTYTTVSRSK